MHKNFAIDGKAPLKIKNMKILPFLLFCFYFGFDEISEITGSPVPCESNDGNVVWTCVQNQDQTLNITIDCSLNKIEKNSAEIWIWSSLFPIQLKALTIQNCDKLIVNTTFNANKDFINFRHLEIRNISNLILGGKKENGKKQYSYYYYPTYSYSDFEEYRLLPTFTTLKNIKNATFASMLVSNKVKENRKKEYHAFKSLEIKNVTLDRLETNFIGYSNDLTNFLMDNVTILNVEGTLMITINNTSAMIKISNSKFPDLFTKFMYCNASEVIFSGNTFGQLNPVLGVAFRIEANKFSLLGNIIPFWETKSFEIKSSIINISSNTFDNIGQFYVDYAILPDIKIRKLQSSFIFSNNIIHTLARRTFSTISYMRDASNSFDLFSISNNSIDCSCGTFSWFDYMARHELDSFTSHTQLSKWFNDKNRNRCLNLPNCTLNQVLYNFEELCEENYTCLETDVPYSLKNTKSVFKDLLNSLNHLEGLNSKMLNAMTGGKYTEKNVQQKQSNVYQFKEVEAGKSSQNELLYQKEIYSCLILISCLSFTAFTYHALIAYRKWSSRTNYTSKNRTQSETELSL